MKTPEPVPQAPDPAAVSRNNPPTTAEPYRPFPVAALPPPLNLYVEQGAATLGCDPAALVGSPGTELEFAL